MSEIRVDTISEKTSANGVAIDGLTIKDGGITATTGAIIFNEASADLDFRVESNGNANMLHVNGGSNLVGIGADPDLGVGLHIKSADSGASVAADCDELVIENSANAGISILSGNSNNGRISFGDSGGNQRGQVKYEHSTDDMIFNTSAAEVLRLYDLKVATGGETASDASDGGLTLQQNANDGKILSLKSSDIAHGMTAEAEADTYATFQKDNATEGGLRITGLSESGAPGIRIFADVTSESTAESTTTEAAMMVNARLKDGSGLTGAGTDGNAFAVVGNGGSVQFIVKGDGELFSNQSATVGTYDAYEDAQLIRAFDLNHMQGVINSKFDKFVQYNKDDLQKARLIGKDENGNATSFVNWTGMSRLHNGAIWQQYEKTERLANAMYELAKVAVGEDKANEILEQNEIKLLN